MKEELGLCAGPLDVMAHRCLYQRLARLRRAFAASWSDRWQRWGRFLEARASWRGVSLSLGTDLAYSVLVRNLYFVLRMYIHTYFVPHLGTERARSASAPVTSGSSSASRASRRDFVSSPLTPNYLPHLALRTPLPPRRLAVFIAGLRPASSGSWHGLYARALHSPAIATLCLRPPARLTAAPPRSLRHRRCASLPG